MTAFTIPVVNARKTSMGVVVYSDEACKVPFHRWETWRADCPSGRQRYIHLQNQCFRLRWKNL